MTSGYAELLAVLTALRDATARGLFQWRKAEAPDWYEAEGPIEAWIRFKYPEYAFGGSDRDFVEVGLDQKSFRFMIGTEGWDLAAETLSLGMPDQCTHLSAYREDLQRCLVKLRAALDERGS